MLSLIICQKTVHWEPFIDKGMKKYITPHHVHVGNHLSYICLKLIFNGSLKIVVHLVEQILAYFGPNDYFWYIKLGIPGWLVLDMNVFKKRNIIQYEEDNKSAKVFAKVFFCKSLFHYN